VSERLIIGEEKKPWWNSREDWIERAEFEGTAKFTLEVVLQIVIGVKAVWRLEGVIKGGNVRVLKNGGEKFSCECEATIMKRRDASVSA